MNIQPSALASNGYVLLDELSHKELVPFLNKYMKKRNAYSIFYYLINLLFFGLVIYFFVVDYSLPDYSLASRFSHFSYGMAIAFLLIPLHEYIHVLAYKSQGAINTSYAANLKKFYFMALADQFVASRKEFIVVALAPFLSISLILTVVLPFVTNDWGLTIAATLFAHAAMCGGDFGLLSYFQYHKHQEVVTYDDVPAGMSYFFARIPN